MEQAKNAGGMLVLIPALDEAKALATLLPELRRTLPDAKLAVIDDGSTDETAEVAAALADHLLRLPFNVGIGGAVQTGFRFALERRARLVVRVDGDGQHPPAEIARLLEPIAAGEADLVVGSRFITADGFRSSGSRRLGIWLLASLTRLLLRQPISDPTSGFWAAGPRAIELLASQLPHDYPEVENRVAAHRAGLRVLEVPVSMAPRRTGRSSIGPLDAVYYMIKVLIASLIDFTRPASRADGGAC